MIPEISPDLKKIKEIIFCLNVPTKCVPNRIKIWQWMSIYSILAKKLKSLLNVHNSVEQNLKMKYKASNTMKNVKIVLSVACYVPVWSKDIKSMTIFLIKSLKIVKLKVWIYINILTLMIKSEKKKMKWKINLLKFLKQILKLEKKHLKDLMSSYKSKLIW